MTRATLLFTALALTVVPACSFLGLDKLEASRCTRDDECTSLGDIRPTNDACLTWQCGASMHCEVAVLDADGDGAPAMMCAAVPAEADCDDANGSNAPDALGEMTCDGGDNDCDGRVDEGLIGNGALVSLIDLPDGASEPVFGRAPDADETAIAVLTPTGTGAQLDVVLDRTSALLVTSPIRTVGGTAITPTGVSAIEGLGGNRYAVFFEIAGGTCPRSVLGVLDTSTRTVRVADTHAPVGFPNLAGDCSMGATSTGELGLDATSGDLLVAYLESTGRDCGTTAEAPVLVVGAPDAVPAAVPPLELGQSVDAGPPAVLSLGGRAFLVAFPIASGAIEVHRVTLAADGSATAELEATVPGDSGGLRGDVRLAAGVVAGGVTEVALTYAYGCGVAPVAAQFLDVSATDVTLGVRVEGTAPTGARHAVAAYHAAAEEWLLAWRTRASLGGLRIDDTGVPIGGGFALASTTMGYESSLALVSPGRASGYRALSTRADAGTTTAVAIEVGCTPSLAP